MTASDQSLLVTGGSGTLGSRVLRVLAAAEAAPSIVIGSRSEPAALPTALMGGRHWPLDLERDIVLPEGIATVLHIAGEKRDEKRMWEINDAGTRRLIAAAARAGVRRLVHISSVGVYGAPPRTELVDTAHARTPRNVYEASKNAAEAAVRELCPRLGIEFMVVQPTNVLAPSVGVSYPLLGLMSAIQSGRFAYLGRHDAWLNYVHVDDVASAIAAVVASGTNGATYIVNTPARMSVLAGWIADELGVPAPTRRFPAWLGALAGQAGSALQRAARRSMPFTTERYAELTNATRYEDVALREALGLRYPIGIEAAVRSLVVSYRAEGRL